MSQFPPTPQPFGPSGLPPQPGQPAPVGYGTPGTAPKKTSGAAIASLICGVLGCIPLITGLLAVILGFVGIRSTRNPNTSGRGMAVAGLILGLVSILGWGFFLASAGMGALAMYNYGKEGRELGRAFAQDLASNNIDAALAKCTSKITRKDLTDAANNMKSWGALNDTTLFAAKDQTGAKESVTAFGVATFATAQQVPYGLHMVKEGNTLKVDGFLFQHPKTPITVGTPVEKVGGAGGTDSDKADEDEPMQEETGTETESGSDTTTK